MGPGWRFTVAALWIATQTDPAQAMTLLAGYPLRNHLLGSRGSTDPLRLNSIANQGVSRKFCMNFDRLNRNTEDMIHDQPHFRERIELARRSLNGVHATDGGLHFPGGVIAGPEGCTCQEGINCVCVHLLAWRIFTTKLEERAA